MRPGAHQTRALIGQRRQFDLQTALMGARPFAEYFEDQPGAVDDLGLPASFEIALLHRAQCGIDNDETDVVFADQHTEFFDGATAQKTARTRPADTGDLGADHIQTDRLREADRFFQASLCRTSGNLYRASSGRPLRYRAHHERPTRRASVENRRGVRPAQDSAI